MGWFNYYGLAVMAIIMIPNIIFGIRHKNDAPAYRNRVAELFEQIGRYGCFIFMIFNLPYTYFGFWFEHALVVYLCGNGVLCLAYLLFWGICRNQNGTLRALSLSVLPTCVFLLSGVLIANIPLIVFSLIFAVFHIFISCKNAE